jgi:hypothetical protein
MPQATKVVESPLAAAIVREFRASVGGHYRYLSEDVQRAILSESMYSVMAGQDDQTLPIGRFVEARLEAARRLGLAD